MTKRFQGLGKPDVVALEDVALEVADGAAVGMVGESGSGKSTLLRCLMRLERPTSGRIEVDGTDVISLRGQRLAAFRRDVQMVFQDPMGSLNPKMSIGDLVEEGMIVHRRFGSRRARTERANELLSRVGLDPALRDRFPESFSGGQRQRIAIARALAVEPRMLVCDEPVSALDVSVQAQVLNLLMDMQKEFGLGLLFVAHDLAVVRYVCADIAVLRHGRIVERAGRDELFGNPRHEYTRELIAAIPQQAGLRPADAYALPPTSTMED
ncbi:MAG TPA: ABC transporter ATP-binding protein [Microlunatus sp.]